MTRPYLVCIGGIAITFLVVLTAAVLQKIPDALGDASLPNNVMSDFHFTVTADPRSEVTRFDYVLIAMNDHVGGPGAFHVSPGDIDPSDNPQILRDLINLRHGYDAVWYPGIGNHERESPSDMTWLRDEYNVGHDGRAALNTYTNEDGPLTCKETTYSWDYGNAHFVMLNQYWNGSSDIGTDGDIVPALYDWLAADLQANTQPIVFVFGHEPAFPFYRHIGDSLDKYPANRDAFWQLLEDHGVYAFLCGHTHAYSKYQHNADGVWQIDAGNAGNDSSPPDNQTFVDVTVTASAVQYDIWRSTVVGGSTYALSESWSEPVGPKVALNPVAISRNVNEGSNLTDDSVTVGVIRPGTVNYTIEDDVAWLSLSSAGGSLTDADPPDQIDVIYDVSGLSAGTHQATITVTSDAVNSPKTIDVTVDVSGAMIALNYAVINRLTFIGDSLSNSNFTVANGGPGTLDYTIEDDADWLDVVPADGSVADVDPPDSIDIIFTGAPDLPAGEHTAYVTVSSPDAANSPQVLTVILTVETVSPDFDGDGDVDLDDFGHLQACLADFGATPEPECEDALLATNNGHVDIGDLQILLGCMSGANIPADRTCDD